MKLFSVSGTSSISCCCRGTSRPLSRSVLRTIGAARRATSPSAFVCGPGEPWNGSTRRCLSTSSRTRRTIGRGGHQPCVSISSTRRRSAEYPIARRLLPKKTTCSRSCKSWRPALKPSSRLSSRSSTRSTRPRNTRTRLRCTSGPLRVFGQADEATSCSSEDTAFRFLEAYIGRMEGLMAVQVWSTALSFVRDVLANQSTHRSLLFPTLRCVCKRGISTTLSDTDDASISGATPPSPRKSRRQALSKTADCAATCRTRSSVSLTRRSRLRDERRNRAAGCAKRPKLV